MCSVGNWLSDAGHGLMVLGGVGLLLIFLQLFKEGFVCLAIGVAGFLIVKVALNAFLRPRGCAIPDMSDWILAKDLLATVWGPG
jgi:hypothetical protein